MVTEVQDCGMSKRPKDMPPHTLFSIHASAVAFPENTTSTLHVTERGEGAKLVSRAQNQRALPPTCTRPIPYHVQGAHS